MTRDPEIQRRGGTIALALCGAIVFVSCSQEAPQAPPQPVAPAAQALPAAPSGPYVVGGRHAGHVLEESIRRALAWLAERQTPQGAWPQIHPALAQGVLRPDAAKTALAVCAIACVPPDLKSPHVETLEKGIAYLLSRLGPEGAVAEPDEPIKHQNYATALTLVALSRYDREKTKDEIARMLRYFADAQLDKDEKVTEFDWAYGGWNYYDEPKPYSMRADLSVFSYVAEALRAGELDPKSPVWEKALGYLGKCQNTIRSSEKTELDDGGFFFSPRNSKAGDVSVGPRLLRFRSYGSMTSDGLRSLLYAGLPKDAPRIQAAFRWLSRNYTLDRNPGFNAAGQDLSAFAQGILFYYYHSLAKALSLYGQEVIETAAGEKRYWMAEMIEKLSLLQKKEGFWSNPEGLMNEDDPTLATSLALLTLGTIAPKIPRP